MIINPIVESDWANISMNNETYVLMIIEISAGTTMYRWMDYDILTVTMIIYDQKYVCINYKIGWNNNDVFAVTMIIYDKSCAYPIK